MKRTLALSVLASLAVTSQAWAVGSPSSVMVNVHAIYASTSEYCANLVKMFQIQDPQYQDFTKKPTLGSVDLPDGDYKCVAVVLDDHLKFVPKKSEGSCTVGTEYAMDLCRSDSTYTDLDGSSVACEGTSQQGAGKKLNKIVVYFSTASASLTGNGFKPPTASDTSKGMKFDGFTVAGSTKLKMEVDFRDRINGSETDCSLMQSGLSFKKE